MKKFLVLASILLVLTLAFVACTSESDNTTDTTDTTDGTAAVTDAGTAEDTTTPTADSEEPSVAPETDAATVAPEAPTGDVEEPTAAPEQPSTEKVVIDPRDLPAGSITGHQTNIVDSTFADHFAMIQAAGLETGAMIHQGSIYVGDYDLTKYSKIVIYYATDWSDATQTALAAAKEQGFGCLGVCAIDCKDVVNPDRQYFACEQYTPDGGWVITAHEMSIVGIGYSGPVYVSADFLPGQFIIIDRVELIP